MAVNSLEAPQCVSLVKSENHKYVNVETAPYLER